METRSTGSPIAYFYYGKRFLGAAFVPGSLIDAHKHNLAVAESIDRENVPYIHHCTHAEISLQGLDVELSVTPEHSLWSADNFLDEYLSANA